MGLLGYVKKAASYTPIGLAARVATDEDMRGGYMKGGIPGAVAGYYQGKAKDAQLAGLNDASSQLEDMKRESYNRRMADLNQAMKFYAPVRSEMKRLYGMDFAMPQFGGFDGRGGGAPMLPGSNSQFARPGDYAGQFTRTATPKLGEVLGSRMQRPQLPGVELANPYQRR